MQLFDAYVVLYQNDLLYASYNLEDVLLFIREKETIECESLNEEYNLDLSNEENYRILKEVYYREHPHCQYYQIPAKYLYKDSIYKIDDEHEVNINQVLDIINSLDLHSKLDKFEFLPEELY